MKKFLGSLLITLSCVLMLSVVSIAYYSPGDMNMESTAGDECIIVTWDEIDAENVSYVVFISDVDGENYTEIDDTYQYEEGKYTYVIEGLENDKTYTVGVEAKSENFEYSSLTAMADETPYNSEATVPDAPLITEITKTESAIAVSWNAPDNNGGAKIIGYEIECWPEGSTDGNGGLTIALDADVTSYTIDEYLENGVSYEVKICAINPVGRGEYGKYVDVKEFEDVHTVNHWATENIDYVYLKGLMNGTDKTHFSPNELITRAMFVTILWRMENKPVVNYAMLYEDVESDDYFAEAVRWATSEKIVNGVTMNSFAPNDTLTREQMATLLYRYAQYKQIAPIGAWAIRLDYADISEISDYATEGIMYCKLKDIMTGKNDNEFAPKENATRAETAVILERFLKTNTH